MIPIPKKNVQVPLRAELAQLLDPSGGNVATRVEEAVVLKLFQEHAISLGKGAELLGITLDQFWQMLSERQIPVFEPTLEEILEDARVSAAHHRND